MGKTIRRKSMKGDGGYYEYKNAERNHPKASENYIHGDMPNRGGRWRRTFCVKDAASEARRVESRKLSTQAVKDADDAFFPKDDNYTKVKSNPWYFD